MQPNTLIFGFKSIKEFFCSIFGIKTISLNVFFSVIATVNTFITKYIYDDAAAVFFLVFLIFFDAFTGICKAIKFKSFSSSKLPRILVLMIMYVILLGISWNAARFSAFFVWLPSVVYGGMIGTLIVSIFENMVMLGYIPKNLYETIKNDMVKKIFKKLFGSNNLEKKNKNETNKAPKNEYNDILKKVIKNKPKD